ncbi:MAG: PQQ-binding-like beta-propeller repeat protein [Planctomycetes bacterium]|nr:PQQ-binding-like beta-propeller repeat protein [Planctomycetota bacterium]
MTNVLMESVRNDLREKEVVFSGERILMDSFLRQSLQDSLFTPWSLRHRPEEQARLNFWSYGNSEGILDPGLEAWSWSIKGIETARYFQGRERMKSAELLLPWFPVVVENVLYIAGPTAVTALDASTGRGLWQYQDRSEGAADLDQPRDEEFTPAVSGDLLAAKIAGRLVCLDRRSGTVVWDTRDSLAGTSNEKFLAEMTDFTSPVAVPGQFVICGSRLKGEVESVAAGFDGASGKLVWERILAARGHEAFLGLGYRPCLPIYRDGSVYVVTQIGAFAALDAATGDIRWVRTYDTFLPGLRKRTVRDFRRWHQLPPREIGGMLYATPQDSNYLYAVDVVDGQILWRYPRGSQFLLAASNSRCLFLAGRSLMALDRRRGRVLWETRESPGEAAGVGLASETEVLVPATGGLWRVDASTGASRAVYRWHAADSVGSLLQAGERLLVCGSTEVACLESLARTMARCEERLAQPEREAQARDDLGHLAWRRGDLDGAVEELEKAVALYLEEADALRGEGEIDRAQRMCREALMERGGARLARGAAGDAETDFRRASTLSQGPRDAVPALHAAAEAARAAQNWKSAVELYQQLLEDHGERRHEFVPGVEMSVRAEARRAIGEVLLAAGRDVYLEFEQEAELLAESARNEGRAALWRQLYERFPNSELAPEALLRSAVSRLGEGDAPGAILGLEEWRRFFSGGHFEPEVLYRLAEAYEKARQPGQAALLYRRIRDFFGDRVLAMDKEQGSAAQWAGAALERLSSSGVTSETRSLAFPLRPKWQTYSKMLSGSSAFLEIENADPESISDLMLVVSRSMTRLPSGVYDQIECHSRASGAEHWSLRLPSGIARSAAAGLVGGLLVLKSGPDLLGIRAATGERVWQFARGERVRLPGEAPETEPKASEENPELPFDWERLFEGPETETEAQRWSGVAFDAARVYGVTVGRRVYALDGLEGRKLWNRPIDEAVVGPPLFCGENRLVLCTENPVKIYLLDATDGSLLFSQEFPISDSRLPIPPVVMQSGTLLALLGGDQTLQVFDLVARQVLWKKKLGPQGIQVRSAAAEGRPVLVLSPSQWTRTGQISVLDGRTGEEIWNLPIPDSKVKALEVSGEEMLVLLSRDRDVLSAFPLGSGDKLWEAAVPRAWGQAALAASGELVLVAVERMPKVYLYARRSGALLDEWSLPGRAQLALGVYGDTLGLATDRGLLAYSALDEGALSERAAELLANLRARPEEEAYLEELAGIYFRLRQADRAIQLLSRALESETLPEASFRRLHDQLTGLLEHQSEITQPVLEIRRFTRPPEIDGELTDAWRQDQSARLDRPGFISRVQEGGESPRFWRGRSDLSGTLYLGWDEKNLYIAVEVSDDVSQSFSSDSPVWKGDGLMIAIDPDNDGGYGYDGRDYVFTQALMNKPPNDQNDDDEPEGQYAVRHKPDGTGTIYESAIPWSYVNRISPRPGSRFGFNIYVTDDDTGRGCEKGLTWTAGFQLHRFRDFFSKGYVPQYFGKVILKD